MPHNLTNQRKRKQLHQEALNRSKRTARSHADPVTGGTVAPGQRVKEDHRQWQGKLQKRSKRRKPTPGPVYS